MDIQKPGAGGVCAYSRTCQDRANWTIPLEGVAVFLRFRLVLFRMTGRLLALYTDKVRQRGDHQSDGHSKSMQILLIIPVHRLGSVP